MYCPQCGVAISVEGSFCGKCGKDVAYLTQKEKLSKPGLVAEQDKAAEPQAPVTAAADGLVVTEAEVEAAAKAAEEQSNEATDATDATKAVEESDAKAPEIKNQQMPTASLGKNEPYKKPAVVYFCNSCGTAVFAEDNYCYECGKKTQKEYYHQPDVGFSRKKKILFGLVGIIAFFGTAWFMYRLARSFLH